MGMESSSGASMPSGYPGMNSGSSSGGPAPSGYPGMSPGSSSGEIGFAGPGGEMSGSGAAGEIGFAGPGGSGGTGTAPPGDFTKPQGAVEAFLAAAKARDPQRLAESIALRADTEAATVANKKLFQAAREMSLEPETFDLITKQLEDYKIVGQNQTKSSGTLGFIIGKTNDQGEQVTRTVFVRKEKAGWKVKDITGERTFKQIGQGNRAGGGRGGSGGDSSGGRP
jgi:hypothetical protein